MEVFNLTFSADRIGADIFIHDLIAPISLFSTVDDIINGKGGLIKVSHINTLSLVRFHMAPTNL